MDSKSFINKVEKEHKGSSHSMSFVINMRVGCSGLHFRLCCMPLPVLRMITDSCLGEEKYKIDISSFKIKFVLFSSIRFCTGIGKRHRKEWFKK